MYLFCDMINTQHYPIDILEDNKPKDIHFSQWFSEDSNKFRIIYGQNQLQTIYLF